MSGIIVIAPLLAFITCGVIWLTLRGLSRKHQSVWMSRLGCAVPLLLFPFVTVGYFVGLQHAMTETGANSTPQAANDALLTFDVPVTATAVDFRHAFFSGTIDEANFSIAEKDFLDWLELNGWKGREFYTDKDGLHWIGDERDTTGGDWVWVWPLRFDGDDTEYIEIVNGYQYTESDTLNLDAGFNIVYDKDSHRAYVWRTTF